MLFFLAEFMPPTEIVVWLGCAYFALGFYNKVMEAKKLSAPATAIKVSAEERPVTRSEFDEMKRDVKDMEGKLDDITKSIHANHIAILHSVESHSGDLQTRINGLVLEVARIETTKRKG